MRRASLERPRTLRVWRAHNRLIHEGDSTDCVCDEQPGRFRKTQRVAGCGNARCYLCHWNKLLGFRTRQEWCVDLTLHEWRFEFGLRTQRPKRPE